MKTKFIIQTVLIGILATACEVPNDIPYPVVEARISAFDVEGQCTENGTAVGTTEIDKASRTLTLFVCDTVNLKKLPIKRIELKAESRNPDITYNGTVQLLPDSAACHDYINFPRFAFNRPEAGQDTRMDFSNVVKFTLRTYQDYEWKVQVTQIINRELEVENQVGQAVIDPHTRTAVIYVRKEQNLAKLKVHKFKLGGTHGKVAPDPTAEAFFDFSKTRKFEITTGWGEVQQWRVVAFHTEETVKTTAHVFPRTVNAYVDGDKPNGSLVNISFKATDESEWHTVPEEDIIATSTNYAATIKGLKPGTTYEYRVNAGDSQAETQPFTTTEMLQLENSSFDNWSEDEKMPKLVYPWGKGDVPFWDTGNRGATTVSTSNSVPSDDTSTGTGLSAYLESRHVVIKFAAGNIFTGTYLRTDGTNGILGFGKPFCAFPTKLTFDYKFHSTPINKVGDELMRHLEGRPDSCHIYAVLWHVEENEYEEYNGEKFPLVARTRPSERHLFSPDDPRVIAFGEHIQGKDVTEWTTHTLELKYRAGNRIPTHILVVASSSKYGDYFTGGVGTLLQLDNLKLHYE